MMYADVHKPRHHGCGSFDSLAMLCHSLTHAGKRPPKLTILCFGMLKGEAHASNELLKLLAPSVMPGLQASGHIGGVHHGLMQAPVPQCNKVVVIHRPALLTILMRLLASACADASEESDKSQRPWSRLHAGAWIVQWDQLE